MIRKALFKKIDWLQDILAEIQEWEYSDDLLSKVQWQIIDVWLYTRKNVPYYQDMPPYAFAHLPFMTRDILNNNYKRLQSVTRFGRGFYENSSAGSTAKPVRFVLDKYYDRWNIATKIHYKRQFGQQPGELECRLWGSERDLYEGHDTLKKGLLNRLYNRKDFNAFKMSEKQMEYYANWIKKNRPLWIEGYIDAMYEFCRFVKGALPSPRGVLVSAGTCHNHMKDLIAETFNCPVVERYGSREIGGIACTCPKGKMHVSSWNAFVEIINGKIYVTSLRNYSMPFIRYEIGDTATGLGECNCGRKTPIIDSISGREMEAFKRKDGGVVLGVWIVHLFGVIAPRKEVRDVQAIQKDYDYVVLKIIPADPNTSRYAMEQIVAEWVDKIKQMMGDITVDIEMVDELFRLPSGKIVYTYCAMEQ